MRFSARGPLRILLPLFFLAGLSASAQNRNAKPAQGQAEQAGVKKADSIYHKRSNIFQAAYRALQRHDPDSATQALNATLVTDFQPYDGKTIRHIRIRRLGFEQKFTDTSRRLMYLGTRILNHLHKNSREWVIRNNLYIADGQKLNPYIVADNERFLRTIPYIQDARILVDSIPGNNDEVDLEVVTKDLFSINAELNQLDSKKFKGKIGDANLAGLGQRLYVSLMTDANRAPVFGAGVDYEKDNIGGTFINGMAGYTRINNDLYDGREDELYEYVRLERPLVSAYSRWAGAAGMSKNKTYNLYGRYDSLFFLYDYNTYDLWGGYNLGASKLIRDSKELNRQFVSLRYFNKDFIRTPLQLDSVYNQRFNDITEVIGQFTLFRQEFYKTNYIYGFGTTEDIPFGYNVSLDAGWYRQRELSRPYIGINANRYIANERHFIQYFFQGGAFLSRGQMQDVGLLGGLGYFSSLFTYRKFKLRQYFRLSLSQQINRIAMDPLKIDNPYGLRYFSSDSATGSTRLSLHTETFIFLNGNVLGFRFAPFVFGDVAALKPEHEGLFRSGMYYGLGGGIRTRNENLVFGTMELRAIWIPRTEQRDINPFHIEFTANLKFRYNSIYVRAPDIVQLNQDDGNIVY